MKSRILPGILGIFAPLLLIAQVPDDSTFSLSPGDVTQATIDTSGRTRLQLTLTPEKQAELSAVTGRNLNKQIKILVCGKLRAEPFVRERMTVPSIEIAVSSAEDALATVKALLTSNQLHKWTDSSGQTHYSDKARAPTSGQLPPTDPVTDERDKIVLKELAGSWAVSKATMNSKENHDPSLLEGNWRFQDNELLLQSPRKGTVRFTLKIDAKAEPKAFHLTSIEPANAGSGWMLFAREGNTLKIAFYDNLKGRPESFEPRSPNSEPELVVVTLSPKK